MILRVLQYVVILRIKSGFKRHAHETHSHYAFANIWVIFSSTFLGFISQLHAANQLLINRYSAATKNLISSVEEKPLTWLIEMKEKQCLTCLILSQNGCRAKSCHISKTFFLLILDGCGLINTILFLRMPFTTKQIRKMGLLPYKYNVVV